MNILTDKEHKKIVLDASKVILQEYKDRNHHSSLVGCALCKVFFDATLVYDIKKACTGCPMAVFETMGAYGCTRRYCKVVSFPQQRSNAVVSVIRIERVIKFYEEFIKLVEKERHCRIYTPKGRISSFGKKLKQLDITVFHLIKEYEINS